MKHVLGYNWKGWLITGLLGLCCILWIDACNQRNQRQLAENRAKVSDDLLASIVKDVVRKKDVNGVEHAVFKTDQKRINEAVALESKKLDTVARLIGIKSDQIDEYIKIPLVIKATDMPATVVEDTVIKKPVYSYTDNTFNLQLRPTANVDTPYVFDLAANINLTHLDYSKWRFKPFGTKTYYTDVFASDKRVTIGNVEKYTIQHKEPGYGFKLEAASVYSIESRNLLTGIGFQLTSRYGITLIGNYYYNLTRNRVSRTIGIRKTIIKL